MLERIKKFGLRKKRWESYNIFGPDGHGFDRRWIFLYREGDNNGSISMSIFGSNITQSYRCNTEY